MPTQPGLTLRVARRFPAERFVTNSLWLPHEHRPASPEEAVIVGWDAVPPAAGESEAGLALLELPRHLLRRWHALLGPGMADGEWKIDAAAFNRLMQATVEFLQFKQCALPAACVCSLEVRRGAVDEQPSSPPLPTGRVHLAFNLGPGTAPVVFGGLEMDAARAPSEPPPVERWEDFRLRWPDQPVIRLDLLPGQGMALPERPWVHDRNCREDGQPVVWLLITGSETS